jgi:hypothetical protein
VPAAGYNFYIPRGVFGFGIRLLLQLYVPYCWCEDRTISFPFCRVFFLSTADGSLLVEEGTASTSCRKKQVDLNQKNRH